MENEKNSNQINRTPNLTKQKCGNASKACRSLYLNEKTADVHFIFDDKKRIPAHKCILGKSSKVFEALFYGDLAAEGDVPLPGKKSEVFENFLQFCYLDEVELKLENIAEVMSLAHEYQMFDCLKLCGQFWANNWSVDDICLAYAWAIQLEMVEFQSFCEEKIGMNCNVIFQTPGFLSCPHNIIERILDCDSLICDESTILGACLSWARNECKEKGKDPDNTEDLLSCLKDESGNNLLHKIRYGLMKLDEFIGHIDANNGLFDSKEEYEDVIRLLGKKMSLKTSKFNTESRKRVMWDSAHALIGSLVGSPLDNIADLYLGPHTTVLTFSRPILLGGFSIANVFDAHYEWSCEVSATLKERYKNKTGADETSTVRFHGNKTCGHTQNNEWFNFENNPILIQSGFEYIFEFNIHIRLKSVFNEPAELHCFDHQMKPEFEFNQNTIIRIRQEEGIQLIRAIEYNSL